MHTTLTIKLQRLVNERYELAKISLVATALAFGVTQLPFRANIDLPLFYALSLSGLVLGLISVLLLVKEKMRTTLETGRSWWAWLVVSLAVSVFWAWFWIASLNKHVG